MKLPIFGRKKAICPQCGGIVFMAVPAGHVMYTKKLGSVALDFQAMHQVFLCATVACGGRPWSMEDLNSQEQRLTLIGGENGTAEDRKGAGSEDRGSGSEAGGDVEEGIQPA